MTTCSILDSDLWIVVHIQNRMKIKANKFEENASNIRRMHPDFMWFTGFYICIHLNCWQRLNKTLFVISNAIDNIKLRTNNECHKISTAKWYSTWGIQCNITIHKAYDGSSFALSPPSLSICPFWSSFALPLAAFALHYPLYFSFFLFCLLSFFVEFIVYLLELFICKREHFRFHINIPMWGAHAHLHLIAYWNTDCNAHLTNTPTVP